MTLKGQHNHYNVKFLKGYGFSVKLKDNKIVLKNGYNPFSEIQEKEEWFIANLPYEKIVLSGKGYISTEALALLNQNNRNLILVDTYGKPISFLNGMMESLTATNYRIGQYDTFRDVIKCKYLSKQIVKAKLRSQIRFLESTKNFEIVPAIDVLTKNLKELELFDTTPIRNEAKSSHVYFNAFSKLIPEKYGFESRNSSVQRITKRNASDVINALLNYGYAVLAGEISKFVNAIGLDAYYEFCHKSHTGFQPLVYDMIEPFRWLVDYSVYKLANTKSKQKILLKEFAHTRKGLVVMDNSLIRRFLELLERTFQTERRYEFRHGAKTQDGLKSCQEITIANIAVQNLADFCMSKKEFKI